jgi:hypothetical protein
VTKRRRACWRVVAALRTDIKDTARMKVGGRIIDGDHKAIGDRGPKVSPRAGRTRTANRPEAFGGGSRPGMGGVS